MKGTCGNIYQIARNNADFTQLKAAELLHISVRTLGLYETGKIVPHSDTVFEMVKLYSSKWLGYEHLRKSTELGEECLPVINIEDLAQSVLSLQKESADVENIKSCMIEIASNSKVDDHQEERWKEVTKEVYEMAGAALSVVFSK